MNAKEANELANKSRVKELLEPIIAGIIEQAKMGNKTVYIEKDAVNVVIISELRQLGYTVSDKPTDGFYEINWFDPE